MAIEKTLLTADDLFCMPDDGMRQELVRGELRTMPPSGEMHGAVAMRFAGRLYMFVEPRGLGEVFAAETGFWTERSPDTVRAPDVAFVAAGRFPEGRIPVAYSEIMPDLLAEVVSPGESRREVEEKVQMWLEAGVRMVFVAAIRTRSASVYESFTDVRVLTENDVLDGGDVLPGFTCPVRNLFPL